VISCFGPQYEKPAYRANRPLEFWLQDLPGGDFMANLIEVLFGCSHKNFSFPITKRRGQRHSLATAPVGTYVVCLDCGQEFAYDWQQMKVVYGKAGRLKTMPAKTAESLASK
jgi:hypothetical protein